MKIRSGFVSNSSSSSFIVGFSKIPTSPEELEALMFNGRTMINYYDDSMSSIDVAKIVFKDMTDSTNKKINKKTLIDFLIKNGGYFPGCPEWDFNKKTESKRIESVYKKYTGKDLFDKNADPGVKRLYHNTVREEQNQYRKEIKIAAKAFVAGFWLQVKKLKVFKFHYSDNDGYTGSCLEHGNIFKLLPNIRISHH